MKDHSQLLDKHRVIYGGFVKVSSLAITILKINNMSHNSIFWAPGETICKNKASLLHITGGFRQTEHSLLLLP